MDAFERVPVFPPVALSSLLRRNFPTFTLIYLWVNFEDMYVSTEALGVGVLTGFYFDFTLFF